VSCHAWLQGVEDCVVVGTRSGKLLLFVAGTLEAELAVAAELGGSPIESVCAFSKGLVVGGEHGQLWVLGVDGDAAKAGGADALHVAGSLTLTHQIAPVVALSVAPSEDSLVCTLGDNQIYNIPLPSVGEMRPELAALVGAPSHGPGVQGSAAVTGMDMCVSKPLAVTCGLDRTVRVWNFQSNTCEALRTFTEEAHSVAFHPSGTMLLVGFSDKLRLFSLLMDDMRLVRELAVKNCRECRFAHGGQYFAAANGNTVQVFASYTCAPVTETLRGHNGKVRCLAWSADDGALFSTGVDGAVYRWNLDESKRESEEFVQKGTQFSSLALSRDGGTMWAVGNDGALKQVDCHTMAPTKALPSGSTLGQLALTRSERTLFSASCVPDKPGFVRAHSLPLAEGNHETQQCVGGPVLRLGVAHDDSVLVAAGADGTVFIFDIAEKEGRRSLAAAGADGGGGGAEAMGGGGGGGGKYAEEVLVTKSDLEEKNTVMAELKAKVDELALHNEYQLRLKDMSYAEKTKEVTEKFTQEIEQEKNKFELLREEKNDMEVEFEEQLKLLAEQQENEAAVVEQQAQERIMTEVARFQQLTGQRDSEAIQWEQQQQQLEGTNAE